MKIYTKTGDKGMTKLVGAQPSLRILIELKVMERLMN